MGGCRAVDHSRRARRASVSRSTAVLWPLARISSPIPMALVDVREVKDIGCERPPLRTWTFVQAATQRVAHTPVSSPVGCPTLTPVSWLAGARRLCVGDALPRQDVMAMTPRTGHGFCGAPASECRAVLGVVQGASLRAAPARSARGLRALTTPARRPVLRLRDRRACGRCRLGGARCQKSSCNSVPLSTGQHAIRRMRRATCTRPPHPVSGWCALRAGHRLLPTHPPGALRPSSPGAHHVSHSTGRVVDPPRRRGPCARLGSDYRSRSQKRKASPRPRGRTPGAAIQARVGGRVARRQRACTVAKRVS